MASVLASAVVPMISGAMWAPDVLAASLLLVAIGLGIWSLDGSGHKLGVPVFAGWAWRGKESAIWTSVWSGLGLLVSVPR